MALCFLKAVFFYPAAIARRSGPYTALQKLFAIRSLCGDAEWSFDGLVFFDELCRLKNFWRCWGTAELCTEGLPVLPFA
ncbi:hypothetical protein HPP92_016444 [Vanilla planifolia]|uniref:Uncharacterized protein n=1 Tax=Vanilla planifolia TaxID=51239 RepID=A0A835QI39_VANPL|nr:hypothetical protein HPP92_016444 [Vanilla planifolia]